MDAATLVDVRITCAYQSEREGLHTVSVPVMLVPACANCYGCCDQQPCVACGAYICSGCTPQHACCCSLCGTRSAFFCNVCSLPLCAGCEAEHDCTDSMGDKPATTSDGEPEGEPVGETGDDTWQPQARESTYSALRELWAPHGTPMARLKNNMWVEVVCAPQLCLKWLQAPGQCRTFGEEVNDFSLLCEALAWEFPQGAAIIHVDKKKTIVCGPGRAAHAAHVSSALSWLRALGGQSFGVVLRSVRGRLQGAFLDVYFQPRTNKKETTQRRRAILKAVKDLTTARA